MGRLKKFGKRKFLGNQWRNKDGSVNTVNKCKNKVSESVNSVNISVETVNTSVENVNSSVSATPRVDSRPKDCETTPASASNIKLASSKKLFDDLCKDESDNSFVAGKQKTGYLLVDIELLSEAISGFVQCKYCSSTNCISVLENSNSRRGLACRLVLVCKNCGEEHTFPSSKYTNNGYEVNLRFVYSMRCIGKGSAASKVLCSVLNLPKPPTRFQKVTEVIERSLGEVATECMVEAAKEAVQENAGSTDIAIAIDGSWQKRGHTSLNGVVTATSIDNGKVVDVVCLTKYCHGCVVTKNKVDHTSNCVKNFDGASGTMEVEGAVQIFKRSIEERGVRYSTYLGDGDSRGFQQVVNEKPYGEHFKIEKWECLGHVQKRMGNRLRKLVKDMKGQKLADGKIIGGRNRLTKDAIDLLQLYYGNAIRNNTDDINKMKRAVWATYFHKLSTDEQPHHQLCPKGPDSWCKYNVDQSTYKHHGLPVEVMTKLKPIYRDLAHPDLLKKCVHGLTQNPNESFNNLVWLRVPKTTFVGLKTLKAGVYDAVISFNVGNIGRAKVLQNLGIAPGYNTLTFLRELDDIRVAKADQAVELMSKAARQKKRNLKRRREDEEANNPDYGAGKF